MTEHFSHCTNGLIFWRETAASCCLICFSTAGVWNKIFISTHNSFWDWRFNSKIMKPILCHSLWNWYHEYSEKVVYSVWARMSSGLPCLESQTEKHPLSFRCLNWTTCIKACYCVWWWMGGQVQENNSFCIVELLDWLIQAFSWLLRAMHCMNIAFFSFSSPLSSNIYAMFSGIWLSFSSHSLLTWPSLSFLLVKIKIFICLLIYLTNNIGTGNWYD